MLTAQSVVTEAYQPRASLTCSHPNRSFFTASNHDFRFSSSEMLITTTPFSFKRGYIFTRFLFATHHGAHQDAQKSSNTTLPRKEESETLSPAGVGSLKSLAGICNCG